MLTAANHGGWGWALSNTRDYMYHKPWVEGQGAGGCSVCWLLLNVCVCVWVCGVGGLGGGGCVCARKGAGVSRLVVVLLPQYVSLVMVSMNLMLTSVC